MLHALPFVLSHRLGRSHRRELILFAAVLCAACGDDGNDATTGAVDATIDRGDVGGGSEGGTSDGPAVEAGATDAGGEADTPLGLDVASDAAAADAHPDIASGDGASDGPAPSDGTVDADVAATTDVSTDGAAAADRSTPMDATDGGAADASTQVSHVHVSISNTCVVGASPPGFTVPRGQTLRLSWHNHSVDYDADVWLSYGGGFLGLKMGDQWDDRFDFCTGPRPYMAYGDVGIAGGGGTVCPSFRVWIACQ